jgi:hypothetical protein
VKQEFKDGENMLAEELTGKSHFSDLDVDGRIILKWKLKKLIVNWTEMA